MESQKEDEDGVKEDGKGPTDKTHPHILTYNQSALLCRMSDLSTQQGDKNLEVYFV